MLQLHSHNHDMDFYSLHNNATTDLASKYAAVEEKAQTAIDEFLELISEQ